MLKKVTKDNFKKPKKFTPTNYKKFINNFMDLNNWGQNKGRGYNLKTDLGRYSTEYINQCLTNPNPMEWDSRRLTMEKVKTHLTTTNNKKYIYYCNSPLTNFPMYCLDIDTIKDDNGNVITTPEDINDVVQYLTSLFPSAYYEPSTNKLGLHFYLLVDFTDCYEYLDFVNDNLNNIDVPSDIDTYPSFCNYIMKRLVDSLKPIINNNYNVKLDPIKASMSEYEKVKFDYYNEKLKKRITKKTDIIKKSGVYCKLPIPTNTLFDFQALVNQTPINYLQIHSVTSSLASESIVTPITNNYTNTDFNILDTTSLSLFDTFDIDSIPNLSSDTDSDTTIINFPSEEKNNKNTNNTTVCEDISEHIEKEEKISNSSDAFKRSREVGKTYFRSYYKQHKELPTFDEYRDYYRTTAGTGIETTEGKERLLQVYNWLVSKFNTDKVGKSLYEVGEFLPELKNITNDNEIDLLRRSLTKYRRKIRLIDLDIMLGHFFTLLMQLKDKKKFSNKSFTCPTVAIPKFFKSQKEYYKGKKIEGYKVNCCDSCKAKAIKLILERKGLLKCLDPSYSTATHTAKRYFFTKKFSRYRELEEYLGKDFISSFVDAEKQSQKSV